MTAKEQLWVEAANRLNGWGEMKQEDMPTAIQTVQVDIAALLKLQEERDLALAENARLKAAMDKYSEDEMLCDKKI